MQPDNQGNYWNPQNRDDDSAFVPADTPPGSPQDTSVPSSGDDVIAWDASEYIQHQNGVWWYVGFGVIVAILVGLSIWWQVWTFSALIIVMAVAALIHLRRPPRVLHYTLSHAGLSIDDNLHAFNEFKSFGILQDGGLFAIVLVPIRRFATTTTVYFSGSDGERIVDAFGSHLPMEEHKLDAIDRLLRLIRF